MRIALQLTLLTWITILPPAGVQCELQKLYTSDASQGDAFGWRVALSESHVVVSALCESSAGLCAGAAYVFERGPSEWSEIAKLIGSDTTAYDVFGGSVGVAGDTIAIGAPWNSTGAPRPGAVYIFDRVGSTWQESAKLSPGDPTNNMR